MQIERCLVTGASGFIGKALCEALKARGIKIRALLRRSSVGPWDETVIQNLAQLRNESASWRITQDVDTVFHLAGIAHTTLAAKEYWKVNVEATEVLFKAALHTRVRRFIYMSSVKAVDPQDDYGYSKKAAEEKLLQLAKQHDIQVTILQPALVYGRNVKGNLLSMLKGIDQGWFPPPPFVSNQRSLISVTDVVDCALFVAENLKAQGKVYTITDGRPYSSRELYEGMRQALGLKAIQWSMPVWVLQVLAKAGDILQKILLRKLPMNSLILEKWLGSALYSNELIQQELGWIPKKNFFSELPQMIDAYRSQLTAQK